MNTIKKTMLSLFVVAMTATGWAQKDKNVVENAVGSKDHTTLVAAVKAAGLVETLTGK